MSVHNDPITQQFMQINEGLRIGNRIKIKGPSSFASIKKGEQKSSTLEELQNGISEFVNKNSDFLGKMGILTIVSSLNKRAESLEKRGKSIFIGKKTKQIILDKASQLRNIAKTISPKVEATAGKVDENSNVQGIQNSQKPKGGIKLFNFSPMEDFCSDNNESAVTKPNLPPSVEFVPDPKAPPPPPPPGMSESQKTPKHLAVIDNADKLATLKNEPKRPNIDAKIDLGKVSAIAKEDKEELAKTVSTYVKKMQEFLNPLVEKMKTYKELEKENTDFKITMNSYSNTIDSHKKDIEYLESCIKENKPATLHFKGSGVEETFQLLSQAQLENEYQKMSQEDYEYAKKNELLSNYNIENKIENIKQKIQDTENSIKELKSKQNTNENALNQIKNQTQQDMELPELADLVKRKQEILTNWESIEKSLNSKYSEKAKKEAEVIEAQQNVNYEYENYLNRNPIIKNNLKFQKAIQNSLSLSAASKPNPNFIFENALLIRD